MYLMVERRPKKKKHDAMTVSASDILSATPKHINCSICNSETYQRFYLPSITDLKFYLPFHNSLKVLFATLKQLLLICLLEEKGHMTLTVSFHSYTRIKQNPSIHGSALDHDESWHLNPWKRHIIMSDCSCFKMVLPVPISTAASSRTNQFYQPSFFAAAMLTTHQLANLSSSATKSSMTAGDV
jgi:hypothetical protein